MRSRHRLHGALDRVFAKGEIVEGVAMLGGSVLGGYVAQATNLGVPYMLRTVALALSFVMAFLLMHDVGFTPKRDGGALRQAKRCCAVRSTTGSPTDPCAG